MSLGRRAEAIEIIEQLIQRNKSQQATDIAISLFKVAGQASRSLILTTQLATRSSATDHDLLQWINSLFSCRQIDFALSIIKKNNFIGAENQSNILRDLLIKPLNSSKQLSSHERQLIIHYKLYPHLSAPNFNPTKADLEQRLASHNKIILLVIHVGKCAGESIIAELEDTFNSSKVEIIEYHIFDSNILIEKSLPLFHKNSDRIYIVICTRNPRDRWISSFNWDHHTFFLSNQLYCPERAIQLHRQFRTALELIDGLMQDEPEAHELASFKHLAYGHMAKGISWYLPQNIFEGLPKQKISTINVETIQSDFEQCVQIITKTFGPINKKEPTTIPKTKQNYQQWYTPGTFSLTKQFSDTQKIFLDQYLSDDYRIHNALKQIN